MTIKKNTTWCVDEDHNTATIGTITIGPCVHGGLWIYKSSGPDEGEGMQIPEDALFKCLEKFYYESF